MSLRLEISLSPFDAELRPLLDAAAEADAAGADGVWVMDHLSGRVHEGRSTVLEAVSTLAGVAAVTERCRIGTLVANPALRSPVVLAQSLATIATLAPSRLWLGLGAGGGAGDYGRELAWAGFVNGSARQRRQQLVEYVGAIDHLWSGRAGAWSSDLFEFEGSPGFLRPETPPKRLIAGYGPKMAEIAGRCADEFNTAAGVDRLDELVVAARAARPADAAPLRVSAFSVFDEAWLDERDPRRQRLVDGGVDALILIVSSPFDSDVIAAIGESNLR